MNARASLHDHIIGHVRGKIVSGAWPPGTRVPSELELTQQFSCSRMTVNKALSELAAIGMIERRRKAGSFVAAARARSAILKIPDIKVEVEALGLSYRFDVRNRLLRPLNGEDLSRIDAEEGTPLIEMTIVHYGGERPFGFEHRIINLAEVPDAESQPFADAPPGSWLVAKVPFTEGEHRIRAEAADSETARQIDVAAGTACLVIERRTWREGEPITWVRLVYPGEKQEMIARFQPA